MRLAFIVPPFQWCVFDTISIPLGLAWISALLKREIEALEVDMFDLLLMPEKEQALINDIENGRYDLVGLQAHSDVTLSECIRIARRCKTIDPGLTIIIGGNAATFLYDEILRSGCVDYVIIGECEHTVVEPVKHVMGNGSGRVSDIAGIAYKIGSQIIRTPDRSLINDLDTLPLPDRDVFEWKLYPQWGIITSRGCPHKCIFCSASAFWKGFRSRSVLNVLEEIEELKEKYRVGRFYILDDTFTLDKKWVTRIMNHIVQNHFDIEWACLTRADCVDAELLHLFKRAGCVEIHYGVESSNDFTLKLIRKNESSETIAKAIRLTKEAEINVKASVIFGLPGEGRRELLTTVDFLLSLEPNEVQIYPLMPYVGTEIMERRDSYGVKLLESDMRYWKQDAERPSCETELLTKEDIISCARYAVREFKKRGYTWIPGDVGPSKTGNKRIIKTVFAPIQALKRDWKR